LKNEKVVPGTSLRTTFLYLLSALVYKDDEKAQFSLSIVKVRNIEKEVFS